MEHEGKDKQDKIEMSKEPLKEDKEGEFSYRRENWPVRVEDPRMVTIKR